MKKFLFIFCLMLLTSCQSSGGVKPVDVVVVTPDKRQAPAEAMQVCTKPDKLKSGAFGEVITKLDEALAHLNACELKRQELQEFIERE